MFSPDDNENQLSASELLSLLRNDNVTYINGTLYELFEISDLIDIQDLREAAQSQIEGDTTAVYALYINTIKALMDE